MSDLDIREGDLERFSSAMSGLSSTVGGQENVAYALYNVSSAMPGGSSGAQAQYAGEHIDDQILALSKSLTSLADDVQSCATQFQATEDINQQSMNQVLADVPEPCPPVSSKKDT